MQDELVKLLGGRRGHFQMESGYHSEAWHELDRLFENPIPLRPFVRELARRLAAHRIEVVCGPMVGGVRLAREIANELGISWVVAERFEDPGVTGLFPVRYTIRPEERATVKGRRVAIVDDAISAGSAVRGTYADLLACGAEPVVLGALFVFGDAAVAFATRQRLGLEGIAFIHFGLWQPQDCPLCRAGVPFEKVSDA